MKKEHCKHLSELTDEEFHALSLRDMMDYILNEVKEQAYQEGYRVGYKNGKMLTKKK